jgi:hypothetical protein
MEWSMCRCIRRPPRSPAPRSELHHPCRSLGCDLLSSIIGRSSRSRQASCDHLTSDGGYPLGQNTQNPQIRISARTLRILAHDGTFSSANERGPGTPRRHLWAGPGATRPPMARSCGRFRNHSEWQPTLAGR